MAAPSPSVSYSLSFGQFLLVTVSFSWRESGGRIIGEDLNLNGRLDAGEDKNGNGIIDSVVQFSSYIYHQ